MNVHWHKVYDYTYYTINSKILEIWYATWNRITLNYLCIMIIFTFQIDILSLCGFISIIMACSEHIAYLKRHDLNKIQIMATDIVTVNGLRNIHWQMSICCLFDRAVFLLMYQHLLAHGRPHAYKSFTSNAKSPMCSPIIDRPTMDSQLYIRS